VAIAEEFYKIIIFKKRYYGAMKACILYFPSGGKCNCNGWT